MTERNLSLQIDLVNKCNLRCRMCHFVDDNVFYAPRIEIDVERYQEIIGALLPRMRSAMLSCATEPLMGKSFLEALRATRAAGVPFIEFVTNATLFREENLRAFFEVRVDRIQISIDGASRQVFEDIRAGGKFRIVVRNIRRLTNLRRQLAVSHPAVRLNQVLFLHNIEEAEAFVNMSHELGVDELDFRHVNLHPMMDLDDQSLWNHKAVSNYYLGRALKRAEEFGMRIARWPEVFSLNDEEQAAFDLLEREEQKGSELTDWRDVPEYEGDEALLEELRTTLERDTEGAAASALVDASDPELQTGRKSPEELQALHADLNRTDEELRVGYGRCPLPFEYVLVNANARVAPCPFWPHEESMGDANAEAVEDIWKGTEYVDLRQSLISGELKNPCVHCPSLGRGSVDDENAFKDRVF